MSFLNKIKSWGPRGDSANPDGLPDAAPRESFGFDGATQ